MGNTPNYACTRCGNSVGRELLVVKKAVFLEMGEGGRTYRSRVTGWLCPPCVAADEDWNREKFHPPKAELRGIDANSKTVQARLA